MDTLPGDDLVPDASLVIDRRLTFAAPPSDVWPWLVQLGKGRAGWYLPCAVERFVPRRRRASRSIRPGWLELSVGDDVPDWGPGDPVFRVAYLLPQQALVYLSLRDRANGWRWPGDGQRGPSVLALSWALVLDGDNDRTMVNIRLRMALRRRPWSALTHAAGRAIDRATIVLLGRGLSERLRPAAAD